MLFASFDFLLFFLPVLAGYWSLSRYPRARLVWTLVASYFFYMAGARPVGGGLPTKWYFVGLLIISTLLDFVAGLQIERFTKVDWRRHAWLALSLAGNLGLLAYFKYTNFALEVMEDVAGAFGSTWARPVISVMLPVGISFYTFQSLSYTIDVWRGRLTAEHSLLRFAVYVAFFPQLVAGPIVRANEFLPQFSARLTLDADAVDFAVNRIVRGLFKKIVFADFIAAYFTDVVFSAPNEYSSLENLLALYAFTLQIYADFSGYSDIAIGVARLLGFRLPENFDRPYQSTSVGEFWRRWHITLSTWLRDYLFYPLGGSRGTEGRTYFNLGVTMFLVGMWHGASWNFVVYSLLQATAMVFNRFVRLHAGGPLRPISYCVAGVFLMGLVFGVWPLQLELAAALGVAVGAGVIALVVLAIPEPTRNHWWMVVHVALTFHFTTLSRIFFRADNLEQARAMAGQLVHWDGLGVREGLFRMQGLHEWAQTRTGLVADVAREFAAAGILWVLCAGLLYHWLPRAPLERALQVVFRRSPAPILGLLVAGVAWLGLSLLSGPRANIYFAF